MMCALGKLNDKGDFLYYYIHDYQGSLFGEFCLTVIWGKNQGRGRQITYTFKNHADFQKKLRSLLENKMRNGYSVFYSYPLLESLIQVDTKKSKNEIA